MNLDAPKPCSSCGVALWSCPACAFTFDAMHEDVEGGYSCPACAELELRARLQTMLAAQGPGRLAELSARKWVTDA